MKNLDVNKIRADFPILKIKVNGKRFVYLDSASTSQKPIQVIDSISDFYKNYNSNIHRGIYEISITATENYENSKRKVQMLINAGSFTEIIYTRNTTESINVVALTWGDKNIKKGDHILISELEHHSNIVPWIILAEKKGAVLDYIKLDKEKKLLDMSSLDEQLRKHPKIVAVTHVSNVLGTINNIKTITKRAHSVGAMVLVDGAQAVPHMEVDVTDLDVDFYVFSGHKMLAPTGIGVLYAKTELLNEMEPLFGGGDMIRTVEMHSYTPNDLPWKFEAGTSNIEGGIALGVAVDYLTSVGLNKIREHEKKVTKYAMEKLSEIKNVQVFGPDNIDYRGGVIAFEIAGIHPHDVATIFDREGVAIRAGHHCAMPLVVDVLKKVSVSRMSFYLYNTEDEIDIAIGAVGKAKKIFGVR